MSTDEQHEESMLPDPTGTTIGTGVDPTVKDGYDAVYDALPRGETFNRIWRANAHRGEFPAEFAHISFLTVVEARRLLGLLELTDSDVLVDVACGAGGPGLWAAQQSGASLIGIDPSEPGLVAARQRWQVASDDLFNRSVQ